MPLAACERPILEARGISKAYGAAHALDGVDLALRSGEIHGLAGENGAGKSTLVRIFGGAANPDRGALLVDGTATRFRSPRDAGANGISVVHQELSAIPHLSVAENILVGRLPHRAGLVRQSAVRARSERLLASLGAQIEPDALVGDLSLGQQQLVEIARALRAQPRVLLLDEPSAILGTDDLRVLFDTVRRLAASGVCVLYISHRLGELFALTDRVTILRDGRLIKTLPTSELDEESLIRHMTGRQLVAPGRRRRGEDHPGQPPALRVQGVHVDKRVFDVSLTVRRGEIVCLSGLVGSGRTELARAIVGADRSALGQTWVDGRRVVVRQPRSARNQGIGYLPEDRKGNGLLLDRSIRENVGLASLHARSRIGVIRSKRDRSQTDELIHRVGVRCESQDQQVGQLSGGNQQKVLIARWLAADPNVLILDEPTRGVDVGGKSEIYAVIRELADRGVALLVISSEIEEVLLIADRVLVMREGRLAGEFEGEAINEDNIMRAALLATQ